MRLECRLCAMLRWNRLFWSNVDFRLKTAATSLLIFLSMGEETTLRMRWTGRCIELAVLGILLKNIVDEMGVFAER